jgi:hypothetical protein
VKTETKSSFRPQPQPKIRVFQTEWPEGHRLASVIQFRFPECPKIPLSSIITRASNQGLQFVADLLSWDPDKRPNAQQTQRNQYFANVKNAPSATIRPSAMQQSALPSGRLSIMEMEAMDNNGLLSRFSMNPKFTSNADLNEINSLLSVSRLSQNNDKPMIIDPNPLLGQNEVKSSAKAHSKLQSNFNIINDMFNNLKTDTNNNENGAVDKNQHEKHLSLLDHPLKKLDEAEKPEERDREKEKVNDVFINLLKDPKDSLDFTYNTGTSFFLHEPKQPSAAQPARQRRNDSGTSFMMLSKNAQDNSFDEGFFDSLNVGKRAKAPSEKDIVKKWDDGAEDDELASILG